MTRSSLLVTLLLLIALCNGSHGDAEEKPRVLILGDSISIGYTPYVQEMMKGEAVVIRPTGKPNPKTKQVRAENCAGTNNGVKNIDRWLKKDGGNWDIIHFNFGLHDLKRIKADSGQNSNDPKDPQQADLATYEKQLREITKKLHATGAKLIFATTTPYPAGVKPHRAPEDAARYNEVAKKIVAEHSGTINDLYSFALPRLKEIQRPANVHFSPEGSQQLASEVVKHLRSALKK
ncbi:MAG: SGNH/GDSL hydrolase family protein [Planctomycetaceae bacterium]|jgi:lysophospholipase L1-like esterase|nr:SGNH/GDSL hydrolase family protein [Planctomycetaceae bacterium]